MLAQLVEIGDSSLVPCFTSPASGDKRPSSRFSKVVLPEPLGPIRPMRSPRMIRVEKSRISGSSCQA
jgi:hypothetical protein